MVLLSTFFALSTTLATAVTPPPARGLQEITSDGEVLVLPRHHRQPFDGWLFTRAKEPCSEVEHKMLNVAEWPAYFGNMDSTKSTPIPGGVAYELDLKVTLAPTITGRIKHAGPHALRFEDGETKAYSVYTMDDVGEGGCAVRYQIVEERGKSSGWVAVLKNLEASAGDAGNYAAGISSARGFAKAEAAPRVHQTRAGADALSQLAGQGTVVQINRRGSRPTYTLRRRVAGKFSDFAWAVRNKKGYADKTAVVKSAEDRGRTAEYTIGGFGGRASFTTSVKETEVDGVLTIEERPSGGDLNEKNGLWRWTLRPIEGGVDVELVFTADIVAGSRFMTAMAKQDPIARESFMLHTALSFMGDIIGGQLLPATPVNLARE